ncbi:MAG: sigma-70 family RNA polymerase sigma factor [Planctomycetota bacterium]
MPTRREEPADRLLPPAGQVDDAFLVRCTLGGDDSALRKLIDRYDRLVRYTIYSLARERCFRDPQWLDSVASAVWSGFVDSLRRLDGELPASPPAYLRTIARNKTISTLRSAQVQAASEVGGSTVDEAELMATEEDAHESAAQLELLERLADCLQELDDDDRTVISQLPRILERRWEEAGAALGFSESTLRSRWPRVLERLRRCLERKNGFAPPSPPGDR